MESVLFRLLRVLFIERDRYSDFDGDTYKAAALGRLEATNLILSFLSLVEAMVWVSIATIMLPAIGQGFQALDVRMIDQFSNYAPFFFAAFLLVMFKSLAASRAVRKGERLRKNLAENLNVMSKDSLHSPEGVLLLLLRGSERAAMIAGFNLLVSMASIACTFFVIMLAAVG